MELEAWYDKYLKRDLAELDDRRLQILAVFAFFLAVLVYLLYRAADSHQLYQRPVATIVMVGFVASIELVIGWFMWRGFKLNFKASVIPRVVRHFDRSLKYDPEGTIGRGSLDQSRLFPSAETTEFKGEDVVWGQLHGQEFGFAEVELYRNTQDGRLVLFQGLFFETPLTPPLPGRVLLVPKASGKDTVMQWIGLGIKKSARSEHEVTLGDAAFAEKFDIFTDKVELAERFLTRERRKQLLSLCRAAGRPVHVTFRDDKVYVAVPRKEGENLFEPKLFAPIADLGLIRSYLQTLRMADSFVKALQGTPNESQPT